MEIVATGGEIPTGSLFEETEMGDVTMMKKFVGLFAVVCLIAGGVFAAPTVQPLLADEAAAHGATHVVTLEHDDFSETTTNTAETVALFSVPADTLVEVIYTVLVTPFEDSADAAHNQSALTIGDGGDVDRLLVSQELNENGTEINIKAGAGSLYAYTSADTVDAVVTPNAADATASLDTGKLLIYVKLLTE